MNRNANEVVHLPGKDKAGSKSATPTDAPNKDMETVTPSASAKGGNGAKRLIIGAAALAALALGIWQGREWWTVGRFVESTEDAYVKADIATYSAQVPGTIVEIAVADNAAVSAGDVLLRIDDARHKAELEQARAGVASAAAAIEATDQQIALQDSRIEAAEADLVSAKAQLNLARINADRSRELLGRGATTQAITDQQVLALDQAQAGVRGAEAALDVARGQVPVLAAQRHQQEAALNQAKAAVVLAQQNVDDTVIRARRDGVVGNRGIDLGEYVGAGTKLISLVPLDEVYVIANFKETQVQHFRPGMKVDLSVDMIGGAHVKGEIDSIAPAAGSEFALLPTENATGNFTKIVQRIPVRIRIDLPEAADGPRIRPGTSVVVEVNTREAR